MFRQDLALVGKALDKSTFQLNLSLLLVQSPLTSRPQHV
jgi:hypothetical protein